MTKWLVVAVTFLFISVAFATSINANINKENGLVEFTTEVCGSAGKKYTVKLTIEEAEEVEVLFDSIREQLDSTETREETEEVFNQAILDLDRYGLLGGLSVKQAQRLVMGGHQNPIVKRVFDRLCKRNLMVLDDDENLNCLIAGKTTLTFFEGVVRGYAKLILYFTPFFGRPLLIFYSLITSLGNIFNPVSIFSFVGIGAEAWGLSGLCFIPAKGWVWTRGINAEKTWNGSMFGRLPYFDIEMWFEIWYPAGIFGFTGLKIFIKKPSELAEHFYMGSALHVKIEDFES